MNAVAFFVLAILVVLASAAAVTLPRLRDAAASLLAACVLMAVLFGAAGAYAVALAQVVVPLAGIGAVLLLLRRGGYRGMVRPASPLPRLWWLGAAVSLGFAALLVTVFSLSGSGWFQGSADTGILGVLGSREPYALVIAAVLAVLGVGIALLLGRTGGDERETDALLAARQRREEHARARREAREQARQARRRQAPAAGGEV